MAFKLAVSVATLALVTLASADTPANCTYGEIRGTWTFFEGPRTGDKTIDCSTFSESQAVRQVQIDLVYPNVAIDQYGNRGTWTLIYNQGFEVTVTERKWFAFSNYSVDGDVVNSYCDTVLPGWSHDVLVNNWACYTGRRTQASTVKQHKQSLKTPEGLFKNDFKMIQNINENQKSWKAKAYPKFEGKPLAYMERLIGGVKSRLRSRPAPAPVTEAVFQNARYLPDSLDWRSYNGQNYVSPVRDQGNCGSCYVFGSLASIESRIRILTQNQVQPVFSPQDVVSCSVYAQGCDGGFPYLTAGKYAQDFGVVDDGCQNYTATDSACPAQHCRRSFVSHYNYVGGYYGACNEELMKIALLDGPLVIGYEVYDDFMYYESGIYHFTGFRSNEFNPFEITNHAVLLVGWGTEAATGEPYWIAKNSWSADWGENGFFRIRRGNDECGFESIAVEITPIP